MQSAAEPPKMRNWLAEHELRMGPSQDPTYTHVREATNTHTQSHTHITPTDCLDPLLLRETVLPKALRM